MDSVMNNLSPHKVKRVINPIIATIQSDLNPIEMMRSKIKAFLRKMNPRGMDLEEAIAEALRHITIFNIWDSSQKMDIVYNKENCYNSEMYKQKTNLIQRFVVSFPGITQEAPIREFKP